MGTIIFPISQTHKGLESDLHTNIQTVGAESGLEAKSVRLPNLRFPLRPSFWVTVWCNIEECSADGALLSTPPPLDVKSVSPSGGGGKGMSIP